MFWGIILWIDIFNLKLVYKFFFLLAAINFVQPKIEDMQQHQ
jgi:hypothetical protein